jgi:hypothetical protein
MKKTILHRLFGAGKIPAEYAAALDGEGILLSDEGIRGSVTYRNFRSPGRRSNWRREWYTASIALSRMRLIAFRHSSSIINVPLSDRRLRELKFSAEDSAHLLVAFDASLFQTDWSGTIEYRFRTPHARAFLDKLRASSN